MANDNFILGKDGNLFDGEINEELQEQTEEVNQESDEETSEEEITQEDQEEQESQENQEEEDPILKGAFELLKDRGIFRLPEDFEFKGTEDDFEKAIEVSQKSITESVERQLIESNPEAKPLVEYALNGGKDFKKFFEVYSTEDINELDPTTDEGAIAVIQRYFKETSKLGEDAVQDIISSYGDSLYEKAEKFQTELKSIKEEEQSNFQAQQKELQKQQEKDFREYREKFTGTLDKKNMPKDIQRKILNNFNQVEVEGAGQMPLYDYKRMMIESNPEHFVEYLAFINSYDPKTGFKGSAETKETKKAKSAREYFQRQTDEGTRSAGSRSRGSNKEKVKGLAI